jgi:hypothetical protein
MDDGTTTTGVLFMLCSVPIVAGLGYVIRLIASRARFGKKFSDMNPDDIVIIGKFTNESDAYRCQAILKHSGIRCMVEQPIISQYRLRYGFDYYPIYRVEVFAGDAERANEILVNSP